jgi:four helix bundle protein
MKGYKDLIAWQKAMELVTAVYKVTQEFPKQELYGLTSQLRRAAVSIPSNLAEGQGRNSPREFYHFVGQARGSLLELETQLQIAHTLGYLSEHSLKRLLASTDEISRMLNGLKEWSAAAGIS